MQSVQAHACGPRFQLVAVHEDDAAQTGNRLGFVGEVAGGDEQGDVHRLDGPRGAGELLHVGARHVLPMVVPLALGGHRASGGRACGDVDASVAVGPPHDHICTAVAPEQVGDVAFERLPGHLPDGRADPVPRLLALQCADPVVMPAEPALDVLDVLAEGDELSAVLTGAFDQRVEHGNDGLAEDVGDALVDVVVEGRWVCGSRLFHRLCTGQVLHVEEVPAHLTCDFAVAEQHGDVEDGPAGEECHGTRA